MELTEENQNLHDGYTVMCKAKMWVSDALSCVQTKRKRAWRRTLSLIFVAAQCEHSIRFLWTHLESMSLSLKYKRTLRGLFTRNVKVFVKTSHHWCCLWRSELGFLTHSTRHSHRHHKHTFQAWRWYLLRALPLEPSLLTSKWRKNVQESFLRAAPVSTPLFGTSSQCTWTLTDDYLPNTSHWSDIAFSQCTWTLTVDPCRLHTHWSDVAFSQCTWTWTVDPCRLHTHWSDVACSQCTWTLTIHPCLLQYDGPVLPAAQPLALHQIRLLQEGLRDVPQRRQVHPRVSSVQTRVSSVHSMVSSVSTHNLSCRCREMFSTQHQTLRCSYMMIRVPMDTVTYITSLLCLLNRISERLVDEWKKNEQHNPQCILHELLQVRPVKNSPSNATFPSWSISDSCFP